MKLTTMALRNLGRNRRRTFLTALSMAIAMTLVMFLNGMIDGLMDNLLFNATKDDFGHINITTKDFRARERFLPVEEYIRQADRVSAAVSTAPGLAGKVSIVEERIRFGVLLSAGASTKPALCIAGDPGKERKLLMLDRNVKEGAYLTKPGEALIGYGIAKDLGLKVGDTLKVVSEKADYGLGMKKFRISGIFFTNVNSLDGNVFQIGLADARELLGMEGGASQIVVMLDDYRQAAKDAPLVAAALEKGGFEGLSVKSWNQEGGAVAYIGQLKPVYNMIYIIVAFLGAFVIANVMLMVVLERKREIGILKALGMPPREILGLFLVEGTMLGAIGSAAGVVAGLGLNAFFHVTGVDYTKAMASFAWPIDPVLRTAVNPLAGLALFFVGVAVSVVIAWLPSRKAAKMDPIEAIRSV
jgi:putative ABC transport system permease protein